MFDYKKVKFILGKKNINYIYKLFFLMFFGALLDSFSVALILPILNIILKKEKFEFLDISINMNYYNYEKLLIIVLGTIILFYILKNIFLRYVLVKQTNFVQNIKADLSSRIYQKYVEFSQIFFLRNNSSIFFRNLKTETKIFVGYHLNSLLNIFLDSIFILLLVLILASVDLFLLIICFLIFFTASLIYFIFYKKKIKKYGTHRQDLEGQEFKLIQETFRSIKDIKFYNANSFFINLYQKTVLMLAKYAANYNVIVVSLKYFFEVLLILSLSIIVIFMVYNNYSQDEIVITVGVFAAASFRVIPSINKIITSLQNLRYSKKSMEEVYSILSQKDEKTEEYDPNTKIELFNEIELKNINFKYPEEKTPVLQNFSTKIKKGTFLGIFGKSGSGKSTLLNLITGLINNYEGSILSDQNNIKNNIFNWRSKFSYVAQNFNLNDTTIASNIAFGIEEENINHEKLINAAKFSKIYKFIDNLPNKFNTRVGELGSRLSGGQIQRIVIARAIYKGSEILVLDEATNSLNKEIEIKIVEDIKELCKKNNLTTIFSTHNQDLIKYFDQIIEIDKN